MFTIGEFSRVAGLTVKTLRFYHEEQLLVPSYVDPQTGYRIKRPGMIFKGNPKNYLTEIQMRIETPAAK